jgi:hypothetical protein
MDRKRGTPGSRGKRSGRMLATSDLGFSTKDEKPMSRNDPTEEKAEESSEDQEWLFRWRCGECGETPDTWYRTDEEVQVAHDTHLSKEGCHEFYGAIQRWPRDEAEDYSWPHFRIGNE